MPEEVLRVQSRRATRQRRVQIAQHLLAAVMLISIGVEHGANSLLPICEIVAGALLIAAVIRERLRPGHHGGGVAWLELTGAAMTTVEAVERTRGPHHVSFVIVSFLQPLVLFMFAIFDAQMSEARYLKADDDTFEMRLRILFRRRIRWENIRGFRVVGTAIEARGRQEDQSA